MGFLRRLFGGPRKKSSGYPKWSFIRSPNDNTRLPFPTGNAAASYGDLDPNKHAIAVAAATAAVAEAALAAAQAAAEVVRLTRGCAAASGRAAVPAQHGGTRAQLSVEELAALRIQSAFRGYLARRALRALKALVKLQALARGHIVRKQMAAMLRRMQTLVRLQARAQASRSYPSVSSLSSTKSSSSQHPRSLSNANYRDSIETDRTKFGSDWLDRWMEGSVQDNCHPDVLPSNNRHEDERSTKILEVDTWEPHFNYQGNIKSSSNRAFDPDYISKAFMPFDSPSKYSSRPPNPVPSLSSEEAASLRSLNLVNGRDVKFRSAENSPPVISGSSRLGSRRGPFTPTRSECSWGYFNGYSGHPNYMANTESSRAKVRSQSAPRQRLELDRYGSSKTAVLQGSWDFGSGANSERSYPLSADLRRRAHQVSNRLNRLGSVNMR